MRAQSKCFDQLCYMFGGLHPFQDSLYLPVGADEVGGPLLNQCFSP